MYWFICILLLGFFYLTILFFRLLMKFKLIINMDNEEDSWSIEVQPDGELVKKQLKKKKPRRFLQGTFFVIQ